jgi:hypothetical protein
MSCCADWSIVDRLVCFAPATRQADAEACQCCECQRNFCNASVVSFGCSSSTQCPVFFSTTTVASVGTFTDVSKTSEIGRYLGKAWGAVATDINNDGRMDLFVANDTTANFLFVNRGGGKFEEIGAQAGVAYSEAGRPRSGMGVDSADFNEDGWMDLFVANIDHEMYSLYQNNHDETFDDQAGPTGIASATRLMSGWGLKFLDYDNDGNLDLFLSNGNPDDLIQVYHKDGLTRSHSCCSGVPAKGFRMSVNAVVQSSLRVFQPAD